MSTRVGELVDHLDRQVSLRLRANLGGDAGLGLTAADLADGFNWPRREGDELLEALVIDA